MPDIQVARKLKISLDAVQGERRRRDIEPFRPRRPDIHRTAKMIGLVGTDIDRRIASRLHIPEYSVRQKRQRLGIPGFGALSEQHHSNAFNWSKSRLALLGSKSDRKIAERLGTHWAVVARKRRILGIPSFYRQGRIKWTKEMVAKLGKVTDWKIAKQYKMKRETVARARRKLGIAARVETRPVKATPDLRPILYLPTRVLCRHYKLTSATVVKLRKKLGVKPLQDGRETSEAIFKVSLTNSRRGAWGIRLFYICW
jgi:hypothetical protein